MLCFKQPPPLSSAADHSGSQSGQVEFTKAWEDYYKKLGKYLLLHFKFSFENSLVKGPFPECCSLFVGSSAGPVKEPAESFSEQPS